MENNEPIRVAALVNNGNFRWCWGTSVTNIIKELERTKEFKFEVFTGSTTVDAAKIKNFNPQVVWSRGPASQPWVVTLAKSLKPNKPALISSITTGGESLAGRIAEEKKVTSIVDYYIVQNEDALLQLGAEINDKRKKIFKIPSGVDTTVFKPMVIERDNAFTIGIAGRALTHQWAHLKGYHLTQLACKLLGVRLVQSHTRTYEKMPFFYNSIDCLVVASNGEGCSNVTFEAMACGIPVISTRVGFHGEECRDCENIYFTARTVPDIMEKINNIRKFPDFAKKIGANALTFAKLYDIKTVAKMYEVVFRSVLDAKNAKEN
jgi:hypothetical protein